VLGVGLGSGLMLGLWLGLGLGLGFNDMDISNLASIFAPALMKREETQVSVRGRVGVKVRVRENLENYLTIPRTLSVILILNPKLNPKVNPNPNANPTESLESAFLEIRRSQNIIKLLLKFKN
jgi:hypothetical protein